MGLFTRPDSPFWWAWLEGAPRPKLNTKIPIGTAPEQRKASRRLAEDVYHQAMANLARRRFGLPLARPSRSFAEHRAWYAEHVSTQKRGRGREMSMLKQLGAFLDDRQLGAIDHALAREWRTQRLTDVSASTVQREEAILKHLLTTAVPKYLERNPLLGLARLRVATPDTRVLTHDEERRFLKGLPRAEDRALVIGALDTLLRLRDIADLRRPQDHGAYLFTDTKVGAVKVPISTRLRKALDALPQTADACFPTYAGKPNSLVIRMFREACDRAAVPTGRKSGGITFHCLRHTGARRMLEAGVNVKTVMEIGGWKNLKILERYLHPSETLKRDAVELIARPPRSRRRARKTA